MTDEEEPEWFPIDHITDVAPYKNAFGDNALWDELMDYDRYDLVELILEGAGLN